MISGFLPAERKTMFKEIHYDESRVPQYVLPDPLINTDGTPVKDAAEWVEKRRPEILALFEEHVYGKSPGRPEKMEFSVLSGPAIAFDGRARRKEVVIKLANNGKTVEMSMLIYMPVDADGPVPTFLGLNFWGNHSIQPDPGITLSKSWMRQNDKDGIVDHQATEATRGMREKLWPMDIVSRGYGLATIYCGDIDPDFDDGFANGVHPLFYEEGQTHPGPGGWGTIGAWAWGLSRAMDYLETDNEIDHKRIAVMGHSRLGKTALWAGAQDDRFAVVISNDSGCGGAAISRRAFGETVARINNVFPHWFCENFRKYNDKEENLPVDQHMLVALMAPRPVYVASAEEDLWADPKGEFLSAKNAGPVYELFGLTGVNADEMPAVNQPVGDSIGYHVRTGGHSVMLYDWQRYMDFADRHYNG